VKKGFVFVPFGNRVFDNLFKDLKIITEKQGEKQTIQEYVAKVVLKTVVSLVRSDRRSMKHKPRFLAYTLIPMPHRDAEEACRIIIRNFPEVPHGPGLATGKAPPPPGGMPCLKVKEKGEISLELRGRENELVEFYDRYLANDIDYFAISQEAYAPLCRLAEIYKEKPWPELKYIHFMSIGPYTWGLNLKDENGVSAFYNDTLRDVVIKQLSMMIKYRQKKVNELFPGVSIIFDLAEPSLALYSSAVGSGSWDVIENAINEVIEGVDGITGIHCCDNFDWSLLMKTNLDLINFDAYHHGNTMSLYTDELKKFLERGGMISWGIIPTTGTNTEVADIENEDPNSLVERLEQMIQLVTDKGIDKEMLLESSWITPTCSTQAMSIELSERVYDYTREVSQRMREKYYG